MNNPYIAGAPLRASRTFFGRQDILQWAMQELRNPASNALVLFGQRRIGKTSLLLQLQSGLPREAFLPVYFDLQDQAKRPLNQMLLDLVDTITERAGLDLPKPVAPDERGVWFRRLFLPEFYKQFGEARRLVFLFDEFDVLDQAAQANLAPSAAANAFFEFLRRLMGEDPRPAFVFVVGRRAEDMNIDFTATFKSSLVREVWTLDADSAEELVRQAEANGSLKFTDDAVQRVLALTNSHPYLTQLLCQRIWERAYLDEPEAAPTISAVEVETAVPDALEAGNQALVWLWNGLAPAEKIYASALAEASAQGEVISKDRVIQTITEHATRLRTRDVELAPDDLVKRRVLEASGPREFRFAVEFFRRWVAANKPLREVKDELDRVDPLAEQLFGFGVGFFKRQQWQLAARYFADALQNNPRHFRARLNLGEALLEMKRTDEAVAELENAYALDNDEARLPLARALIERAKLRDRAGAEDNALLDLEGALLISPNEAEARALRTAIYTRRGDAALTQKLFDQAVEAYGKAGLPEKISQTEAWRKREALSVLEKQASEQARTKNWAAAAEGYENLVQQAEDTESLVSWEKRLAEVRAEQDLAELFAEGATALAERNYTRAQTALQKVVDKRPDYRNNGQTAERLLQRAITEGKQSTFWQSLPLWGWALSTVLVMALVVGVTWGVFNALNAPPTTPVVVITPGTIVPTLITPNSTDRTPDTPAPGTTVAPTVPTLTPTATPTSTPTRPLPEVIEPSNAEQIRPLGRWGKGTISQAAYSPDGRLLAVAGSLGIYLYDAQTLAELSFEGTSFSSSLAWAPDGQSLVSANVNEPTVQSWQVVGNELTLQGSLLGHQQTVRSLAFDNDGRLAAAGFDEVSVWNAGENQRARVFPADGEVKSLAFSADGQWLAVGRRDGVVRVFNANAQGIESQRFDDSSTEVKSVAFSPDGQWLASGGEDKDGGFVMVRNLGTREVIARVPTFNGNPATSLAFTADGQAMLIGSQFGAVELIEISTGTQRWKDLAVGAVTSVAVHPKAETAVTVTEDGVLRLRALADGTELASAEFTPEGLSVAYSADGTLLATGHRFGSVRVWNTASGELLMTLRADQSGDVNALAFSPDGTLLATGDYQKLHVWQLSDGALLHTLTGFNSAVEAVAFSPDGTLLAAGSEDGTVQAWLVSQLENPPGLQHSAAESVRSLAFSNDGRYLAAGYSNHAHVWQTGAWENIFYELIPESADAVIALAFSADSQTLFTVYEETDLIQSWDLADRVQLESVSIAGDIGTLLGAAFSPDGQLLVAGIADGSVLTWNAASGEALGALNGHIGFVPAVTVAPGGRWLASVSADGTVRVWGIPAAGAP